MNKIHLLIILFLICLGQSAQAQYYSVNYDKKTVAAMAAAYNTEAATEAYYNEQVQNILKHYNAAEVATAGIFASKFLDRKALTELGVWSSSTENYYYRRIYNMVSRKIMPKIWTVAGMMLKSPQTALYWGSYLVKICDDTKSLCMQFESVVTNSSLTFSDIAFLQIKDEIASILKLSEIGNVDWQRMLDDLSKVPGNFTVDNLKADIDNLYKTGVNLASAGVSNIGDAFLQSSQFHDLINGKLGAAVNIVDNYSALFEQLDKSVGNTLLGMVGGKDNVAGLFNFANYNLTSWMTDYMSETAGNYYTQRWYIARRDQGSETLCDYYPPTDDNSIIYGGEWTRFSTSDPNFSPSSAQQEQILSNSERCAGWSRSRVDMLNKQNDGFNYYINYYLYSYIISRGGRQTQKSYAYEIHVTKNWNRVEEVYEEVFDSYSMDLNTFKAQLNARLSEFNDNEEGYTYYIGSDSRNYYQATDAGKLKGCESVTISVTCSDGVSLGSGSTQYKCRECSGSLNAHSKECAMRTTITEGSGSQEELARLEAEYKTQVEQINSEIATLEADNQRLIELLTGRHEKVKFLLRNLQFSVLILNTDQIDLAYTFFSNENSRGKSLSDFDLLKAHHLRFITDDMQAGHLAKSWDKMLSDANLHYDNDIDKPYYRSLGLYIFRLRKWMGNEDWDDFAKYKIKDEYEAAPVIDEIPPFGEQFSYKESIQGGTHFFAFVKRFEYKYHLFVQTDEFKSIHKLDNRTHWWFRDVIETFLFAYYLKFGVDYLSEALLAISRIVLQFRFDYKKADYSRLLRQAGDSGIIYMIDCATSPTFALAEMEKKVRSLPSINIDVSPVARDFNRQLREYLAPIRKHIVINKFKLI